MSDLVAKLRRWPATDGGDGLASHVVSALMNEAADALDRLVEDRARFPDRPDFIGNMIGARFKNLEHGKRSSEDYARQAMRMASDREQLFEDIKELLQDKSIRSKQARIDNALVAISARPALRYVTPAITTPKSGGDVP